MTEFYLLLGLAAFVVGLAKGGLTAASTLPVPFLALWMGPLEAAAAILPVYLASDVIAVWLYRKDYSWQNLRVLLPAGLVGVFLAMLAAPYVSVAAVTVLTGVIGLAYCIQAWVMRWRGTDEARPFRAGPGTFWGVLSGITSFISHNGAPPFFAFVMPQRLSNLDFAGTATFLFATVNLAKLPAYIAAGISFRFGALELAPLIAIAAIGAVASRWLITRLPREVFARILQTMLFVVSLYLCVSVFV